MKAMQAQIQRTEGAEWENRGRLYSDWPPAQNYIRKHASGKKFRNTRVIRADTGAIQIEGRGR